MDKTEDDDSQKALENEGTSGDGGIDEVVNDSVQIEPGGGLKPDNSTQIGGRKEGNDLQTIYIPIPVTFFFIFLTGIIFTCLLANFTPVFEYLPPPFQIQKSKIFQISQKKSHPSQNQNSSFVEYEPNFRMHINPDNRKFPKGIASRIAKDRILLAKENVIWITNIPNNTDILEGLVANKNITKLIILGATAEKALAKIPISLSIPTFITPTFFKDEESFLFIDNSYLVDIGRGNIVWETTDGQTIRTFSLWLEPIIKNSQPIIF